MSADRPASYRRLRIGQALRELREGLGMTQEAAGRLIERSAASLSAIENGHQAIRWRDLKFILDQYDNAEPELRDQLLALAGQGRQRGWWHTFEQRLAPARLDFASLESDATAIRSLELHVIPGLLQTEDYARAAIAGSGVELRTTRDREIEVEFRMNRQRILTRDRPPRLWAIIGEAALRQDVGGRDILRGQLEKLLRVGELPHVSVRVLPFAAGAHPGIDGPFDLLDVGPGALLRVAVVHSLTRSWYVDEPPDVAHHVQVFQRLGEIALSEGDSAAMIGRLLSKP